MRKLVFLFFIAISFSGYTQKKSYDRVSIDDFITETQYGSDNPDIIEILWWIPTEYWDVVFAQDVTASDAEREAIVDMVKDFVVLITIKGKIGVFGGVTFDTPENIKSITSVNFKGQNLIMLEEDQISPDMVNFISMIQPMMKNMMGPMGENMQIFVFENPKGESVLPIDPYSNDQLIFKMGDFEKNVSLPLGCLLDEKLCPEDKKELSGKWNFCPYHGKKLIPKN